jgi:hypothetical protein
MQTQGTTLRRWLTRHRRELATGTALLLVTALLVTLGPLLLLVAALEWKHGRRRGSLLGAALAGMMIRAVVWLWQDLRNLPHGDWHPCAQCGAPIEGPSRAWYCSPGCRRYARLERDARACDPWIAERAEARLRALSRPAGIDPELAEIPF